MNRLLDTLLIALAAACVVFALTSCSKDEEKCVTCTTTVETYYINHLQSSYVKAVKVYCAGEASTIQQGQTDIKWFTNGTSERTKVECK